MPRTEGSETFPVVGDRLMVNISNTGVIHRVAFVVKGLDDTHVDVHIQHDQEDASVVPLFLQTNLGPGMGYLQRTFLVDTLS